MTGHIITQTEVLVSEGMTFPLKGATDELIILKKYHDLPTTGAIAGVELKKRVAWSSFYQGQAEWLLYASQTRLPYTQVRLMPGSLCLAKQGFLYLLQVRACPPILEVNG